MRVRAERALAVGLIVLGACYRYVPAALESVPPGAEMRVLLSPRAAASLQGVFGNEVRMLSGRLEDRNAQQAVLLLRSPQPSSPGSTTPLYQRVDVAVPDVLRVDVRVFNKVRTGGLAAALLGAGAFWIVRAFQGGKGGSLPGTPNPVE